MALHGVARDIFTCLGDLHDPLGHDQSPAYLRAFPLDALFPADCYATVGGTSEPSLGAFADKDLGGRLSTAGSAGFLFQHYSHIRADKVDSGARLIWQRPHPPLARREGLAPAAGPR
jgi:hypothetical protein